MLVSLSSFLLILYITCETVRANYAYYAFHTFPQISPSLISLFSELFKLCIAVSCLRRSNQILSISSWNEIYQSTQAGEIDFKKTLKLALPAALYLANNLIYYTVLPLTSPSLLQVCMLAKLPATGILHHFMIKPQRNVYAWNSLLCLCFGLAVFNVPSRQHQGTSEKVTAWYLAPIAGIAIACLSALASISSETSTKTGEFWESQAYLYIWGVIFATASYPLFQSFSHPDLTSDSSDTGGLWLSVVCLVIITSVTGLVVAVVLRAKDNILKVIGTAASLLTIAVTQFLLNPALRASTFTTWKICGGGIVAISTWCYSAYSQQQDPSSYSAIPLVDNVEERELYCTAHSAGAE